MVIDSFLFDSNIHRIGNISSSRAMHQIVYPITARLMHENKQQELNDLYKKIH
jgi:hypothetical protein